MESNSGKSADWIRISQPNRYRNLGSQVTRIGAPTLGMWSEPPPLLCRFYRGPVGAILWFFVALTLLIVSQVWQGGCDWSDWSMLCFYVFLLRPLCKEPRRYPTQKTKRKKQVVIFIVKQVWLLRGAICSPGFESDRWSSVVGEIGSQH